MGRLRTKFLAFDDKLASLGVPPCTEWWREGIGEWLDAYERGCVLELWACVGRGAAKSTAIYKLALFFTLFGDFAIPAGERHYAIVLSRLKEEAAKGIAIIANWLTLLEVPHNPVGDVIELVDDPRRGLRVVAASVSGTSGWRAFFVGKDERSKWPSGGVEDLDGQEIDTSAAAMTATHPLAPVVSAGSAWGAFGTFHDAIMSGTDATKHVLGPAATWIAAPHIREEDTRRKERDVRRWKREYACEFQAGALSAFDTDAIDRAFAHARPSGLRMRRQIILDPSSGKKDAFTFAVCGWVTPPTGAGWKPYLLFDVVDGIEGSFWSHTDGGEIVDQIVRLGGEWNASTVHADQREELMLRNAFENPPEASRRRAMRYVVHPWTTQSKPEAIERVRRWLAEGVVALPPHATLRRELLSFEERITPSGSFTFGARGSGHDDYVALLITAAMAELEGHLVYEEDDGTMFVIGGAFSREGKGIIECSGGRRRRVG